MSEKYRPECSKCNHLPRCKEELKCNLSGHCPYFEIGISFLDYLTEEDYELLSQVKAPDFRNKKTSEKAVYKLIRQVLDNKNKIHFS